jgi:penicillin-binding protein-related factor A (putative recombinase)
MIAGLPDIIGCYLGRFVAFEVKRAPGIPAKPIQEFYLKRIRAAGGIATLIHSPEQALEEIERLEEAR